MSKWSQLVEDDAVSLEAVASTGDVARTKPPTPPPDLRQLVETLFNSKSELVPRATAGEQGAMQELDVVVQLAAAAAATVFGEAAHLPAPRLCAISSKSQGSPTNSMTELGAGTAGTDTGDAGEPAAKAVAENDEVVEDAAVAPAARAAAAVELAEDEEEALHKAR